jgi:hypothetical protein
VSVVACRDEDAGTQGSPTGRLKLRHDQNWSQLKTDVFASIGFTGGRGEIRVFKDVLQPAAEF